MTDYTLIILYSSLALGASFLCSILEAVLLSTTHSHIIALKDTHPKISKGWTQYKEDPERPLTAILTLNTIAHTVGALGVGSEIENNFEGEYVVAISAALLTLAILLLSEILPKTIGALYWRKLTIPSYNILRILMITLVVIIKPIEYIRKLLPEAHQETVTRTELSVMADIAEESDVIEEDEEMVIQNLLKLREISVGSVMTPRVVMNTVSHDETISDVLERMPIMINGRMPITGENIDDISGFVLRNEILRRAANDEHDILMVAISREIKSCKKEDSVDRALDILLENKVQIMIVKDEFGGTSGIITMEDIIETLLGVEIVDEHDQEAISVGDHHEDMRKLAKIRFDNESE